MGNSRYTLNHNSIVLLCNAKSETVHYSSAMVVSSSGLYFQVHAGAATNYSVVHWGGAAFNTMQFSKAAPPQWTTL